MTYELRVVLPYLSNANPNIERMKLELIEQVIRTGNIPAYCGIANVRLIAMTDNLQEIINDK